MPNEKEPGARRKSPATGRASVSGLSSAAQVRAQQEVAAGLDLRGILSKMTAADKVGQLLMCYLDPETLEETISRYRCGTHAALGEPWLIFYSYENMILDDQRLLPGQTHPWSSALHSNTPRNDSRSVGHLLLSAARDPCCCRTPPVVRRPLRNRSRWCQRTPFANP